MKVVIVGGVAGGATAAARIRRLDEQAEIVVFERSGLLAAQGSSPTPQFKSINSSAFNFLYSPTLTSIHDYWKNHSFD